MNLREQLTAGASPAGTWVSIDSAAAAEAVAGLGFDFAVVDTEHTAMGWETVENVVRAIDAAPGVTAPVVRVAWNDHVRIKRALDVGVAGLVAPQVNTPEEARGLVEATRYPPEGRRGIAASRASDYGRSLGEYYETAGEELAVFSQVESEQAVDNAADIARVDGVDALFVGPADLSGSLGVFGEFDSPRFRDAIDRVLAAGEETGVPVVTLATSDDEVERWLDAGFDFLVVGYDLGYLAEGAARALETYRSRR